MNWDALTISAKGFTRSVSDLNGVLVEFDSRLVDLSDGMLGHIDKLLQDQLCDSCGDRLIPGEVAKCGACEAEQVFDLLALKGEFDGDSGGAEAGQGAPPDRHVLPGPRSQR